MTLPPASLPSAPPPPPLTVPPLEPRRERIARRLIQFLAAWTVVFVGFVVLVNVVGSSNSTGRAIILMAAGLCLIWILMGGLVTLRIRDRVRTALLRSRWKWEWKFLLLASLLALMEEAVTTGMTNLAPEFGSQVGVAFITASNNYLIVIGFSSVVPLLVPSFVGWVLVLRRYDFSPNEIFLVYGLWGTTLETIAGSPYDLIAGFWFFVYGLMIYLPSYALPRPRAATVAPRWYHYALGYVVPLLVALPVLAIDSWVGKALGIHLWGS